MNRSVSIRLSLAAVLLLALPVPTEAQEPAEGIDWHLVQYADGSDIVSVPWFVEATLRLEGGEASGSGGCNGFFGSYTLEGDSLRIEELGSTLMGCADPVLAVEDGYLAAFPGVASWSVATIGDEQTMNLRDAAGDDLLVFETPALGLTRSAVRGLAAELDALQAQIDRHEERLDNIRIGTLRDRLKTLEAQVQRLQSRSTASGSDPVFGAAERTLLKGIPAKIRSTCRPLRGSSLPAGTVAAVSCDPSTSLVAEMAYYLMDYADGRRTFNSIMRSHGAPERHRCPDGMASRMLLHPYAGEGCFVSDGRANVRLMYMAAGCSQMDAGGTHLEEPVIYVAIEGTAGRIKPLWNWTRDGDEGSAVTRQISVSGQPSAPACAGGL